jgi:hypothetical protein
LGQLDDIAVEVLVPRGLAPRLCLGWMDNLRASGDCSDVSRGQVIDPERHLLSGRGTSVLCCVQREVNELALGPRRCRVTAADPAVVPGVVVHVQVESEPRRRRA